ncbi:MAG: DnaB-like helicase N-terminal domain-containing protein, partial [Cyanobacteriota bacterium]|nr:DnaB-like helicase N-terminal domain-containing protein [Cyanobacteriota bacterium]
MNKNIHQMPPANIEAEEAVLGGIILDPQAIARVRFHLISEAFYIKGHQDIYSAALQLDNQGKPT